MYPIFLSLGGWIYFVAFFREVGDWLFWGISRFSGFRFFSGGPLRFGFHHEMCRPQMCPHICPRWNYHTSWLIFATILQFHFNLVGENLARMRKEWEWWTFLKRFFKALRYFLGILAKKKLWLFTNVVSDLKILTIYEPELQCTQKWMCTLF